MNDVKGANRFFLALLLINLTASYAGLGKYLPSYAFRLLVSQAIIIVPAMIYMAFFRKSFDLIEIKKIKFSNVMLCIVFYLCISPVMSFLNAVSLLYSSNSITSVIFKMSEELPFIAGWLIVAVIPPIVEEFVFRGILYGSYRKVSALGAVILSGILFGLMHGNLNQFTYACVMGAAFALLYEATGSLLSTAIVHCIVNTFSISMIYLIPRLMNLLSELYNMAAAEDPMTAELIESLVGTDFSTETLFATTSVGKTEAIMMILMTALPAAGGAVLSILIIKLIARRSGRLENIYRIFPKLRRKNNNANNPAINCWQYAGNQAPNGMNQMPNGMYQGSNGMNQGPNGTNQMPNGTNQMPNGAASPVQSTITDSLPAGGYTWKDMFTTPLIIAIAMCSLDMFLGALEQAGVIKF